MNSDCDRTEGAIVGYALGELHGSEMEFVREHVRSCRRCSEAVREVERIVSALSHEGMEEPSEAVCDSVREAVRERVFGGGKGFWRVAGAAESLVRRPLVAGAAALVVAGALLVLVVLPGVHSPENGGKPRAAVSAGKGARGSRGDSGIVRALKVPREFGDYLSASQRAMRLIEGPGAREALAAQEWDRWVAEAMVMQRNKELEAERPLLSDLEKLYREIMNCEGEYGEEEIGRIRQIIAESNIVERMKEVLDSRR